MPRNFFLINVILFAVAGFLGIRLYETWTAPKDVPALTAPRKTPGEKKASVVAKQETPGEASYQGIVEKDLFRPSRTPVPKDVGGVQSQMPQERPQLFGTTITGDLKFAILEDPVTKTTRLYYVNDSIGGFTISDITEEKVVLKWGDDTVDLKLRDNKSFVAPRIVQPPTVQQPPPQQQAGQVVQGQQVQPESQVPPEPRRRLPPRRRPPAQPGQAADQSWKTQ